MNLSMSSRSLALAGAVALALPGAALAKGGHGHSHGHGQSHVRTHGHGHSSHVKRNLNFAGNVVSVDSTSMSAVVHVVRANRGARDLVGQDVTVDLSKTRIDVADVNQDGAMDAKDLTVGDAVLVQVKLAKGADVTQPLAARRLLDRTSPKPAETDETPAPAPAPAPAG